MSVQAIQGNALTVAAIDPSASALAESVPLDFSNLFSLHISSAVSAFGELSQAGKQFDTQTKSTKETDDETAALAPPDLLALISISNQALAAAQAGTSSEAVISAQAGAPTQTEASSLAGVTAQTKVSSQAGLSSQIPQIAHDMDDAEVSPQAGPSPQAWVSSQAGFPPPTGGITQAGENSERPLQPSSEASFKPSGSPPAQIVASPVDTGPAHPRMTSEQQSQSMAPSPSLLPSGHTPSSVNTAAATDSELQAANVAVPESATRAENQPTFQSHLNALTQGSEAKQHDSVTSTVRTPLDSASWNAQFSEKVVWLAKDNHQSAVININPPQLGPIQISLSLDGAQANANFASPHPQVREAIQSSLTELRDMLSANGISLGQANVGSNLPQQQQPQFSGEAFNPKPTQNRSETAILPSANIPSAANVGLGGMAQGRGMVDLFA